MIERRHWVDNVFDSNIMYKSSHCHRRVDCNDVLIRMIKRSYEYFHKNVLEENKMEREKLENIKMYIKNILLMQK